jgi:hypothetical protein
MNPALQVAVSDLSFGLRRGQAPPAQVPTELGHAPSSCASFDFPSTRSSLPSLSPPFPPISISHISQARSSTSTSSPSTHPNVLVFFRSSALPRRSRAPFSEFQDPAFFRFSSGCTYSPRVRLARSHPPSANDDLIGNPRRRYFRMNVYPYATSNTHDTQPDRSRDFEGPPATAGVSRALILPLGPQ